MEQQTTYTRQKRLSRLVFLLGIPNITAVTISAIAARSLIEWLDFVDTLVAMLGMLIVFLISRKMSHDLRYEYNYGVGKVEAMTVIMCEGLEFCGLLAITAVSVMKLIHPEEPSELLIYVVLLKVVNVVFDIFFLREQRKITHASETHVTESEYATIAGKLMFDGAALLSLLLVWLLRDIKLSWYAAPGLSLVIAAYMFTVCVRHVRHAVNDLLDKTLPEEMQMKILKALTRHDSEYSGFSSVKSRHNGTGINIDIAVSFPPETSFESIAKFQNSIQQELSAEIGECHVAVIIENQ